VFWIASMTKPVTGVAVMMLADEGKLSVDDPASKYLPELAGLKMQDGAAAKTVTIKHLMTHTAGLPENSGEETRAAKNLQDLVAAFAKKPMQFEPGARWQYSQTAINALGRIVEVVSGKPFEQFLDERIFEPLGMTDTTFYPSAEQAARLATPYKTEGGQLKPVDIFIFAGRDLSDRDRVPLANGGLFSTAADYGRFVQMLLNDGSIDGKRYLKPETVKQFGSVHTGDLKTGFTEGNGWGLTACVVRQPQGATAALSPGSYGHGGAYGTQGWIDPVRKVGYVLMVQRSNFPNADASDVRRAFQDAAAGAMK
jgi:CubicO group peptidase (beta-lactamase class C family)